MKENTSQTQSINSIQFKVLLIGESGVGKSSIIRNLLTGELDSNKTITHGIKYILKKRRTSN